MPTSTAFRIEGMKCQGCVAEIEEALAQISMLESFAVSLDPPMIRVTYSGETVSRDQASQWLPGKFKVFESDDDASNLVMAPQTVLIGAAPSESVTQDNSLPDKSLATYWPLLLVVGYVLLGSFFAMWIGSNWHWDFGMRMFMGLFFLAFSFFKLLDINGFADAYQGYDWVARQFPGYGKVYPFVEFSLGCCYLLGVAPLAVNVVTLVVMSVSIGGVIESVVKKRTIRCACLGTGFNLPMSQVTIIEDGVMIAMAAVMIVKLGI